MCQLRGHESADHGESALGINNLFDVPRPFPLLSLSARRTISLSFRTADIAFCQHSGYLSILPHTALIYHGITRYEK
jgi:hypothetical protein